MLLLADLLISVLHPARRLQYFKQLRWEQDWIDDLLQTMRNIYEHDYTAIEDTPHEPVVDAFALRDLVHI